MIKKINPIVIVGVLALFLLVIFFSVQSRKSHIQIQNKELANFQAKAKKLKNLKNKWQKKDSISKLNSIVLSSKLKEQTEIKRQGDKVLMRVKNIGKNHINILMTNLLTQAFELTKFSIKRLDDKSLELDLEVKI